MMRRLFVLLITSLFALLGSLAAQRASSDSTLLTVDRIFGSPEFRGGSLGSLAWLSDGLGYTTLEPTAGGKAGRDIVRYDAETGLKTILVPAARLVPAGDSTPLEIEEYSWSADGRRLLIFTKSQQVWRTNTRGDYWVLDLAGWTLKKLGGAGPASTFSAPTVTMAHEWPSSATPSPGWRPSSPRSTRARSRGPPRGSASPPPA